jgi:hypothetical protein
MIDAHIELSLVSVVRKPLQVALIKNFLIYKEIQSGAVAKSYMRKGFLIYEEMRKYSGRGKFMPLLLKSKILETPGSLVTDDIKMFPL